MRADAGIAAPTGAVDEGEGGSVDDLGGDEADDAQRRRPRPLRSYKIQEVIKRRQILLVQVVKEERGNKGAALTTYLSLPGRYCVLMPNTGRGGGISRKITNPQDRKRLKEMMSDLDIPEGMAVILRTAGMERTKPEIKRDLEYLLRLWDSIRDLTLQSSAPALIYEEANLIKRSIRDLYTNDIDEVHVEGENGYRVARDFMHMLMPSHTRKVQLYRDETIPLFFRYQVETQIDAIHSPVCQLKSGGYIVINQTEALVAIDVNSGRSTRERNIEETAHKTNLEAADEIARQLRLRDLAGLIVIDFIDMEDARNNASVERRIKEAMKNDRARIQVGRISPFGLLELSRQRLRPSLMETNFEKCPHCTGTGMIRSIEFGCPLCPAGHRGRRYPQALQRDHGPCRDQDRALYPEPEARCPGGYRAPLWLPRLPVRRRHADPAGIPSGTHQGASGRRGDLPDHQHRADLRGNRPPARTRGRGRGRRSRGACRKWLRRLSSLLAAVPWLRPRRLSSPTSGATAAAAGRAAAAVSTTAPKPAPTIRARRIGRRLPRIRPKRPPRISRPSRSKPTHPSRMKATKVTRAKRARTVRRSKPTPTASARSAAVASAVDAGAVVAGWTASSTMATPKRASSPSRRAKPPRSPEEQPAAPTPEPVNVPVYIDDLGDPFEDLDLPPLHVPAEPEAEPQPEPVAEQPAPSPSRNRSAGAGA